MKYLIIFLTSLVLFFTQWHLYQQGLHDGEQNYKKSCRMYLTLKSAYHFGYIDAKAGKAENWDGE